jgi:hypothetical protein
MKALVDYYVIETLECSAEFTAVNPITLILPEQLCYVTIAGCVEEL